MELPTPRSYLQSQEVHKYKAPILSAPENSLPRPEAPGRNPDQNWSQTWEKRPFRQWQRRYNKFSYQHTVIWGWRGHSSPNAASLLQLSWRWNLESSHPAPLDLTVWRLPFSVLLEVRKIWQFHLLLLLTTLVITILIRLCQSLTYRHYSISARHKYCHIPGITKPISNGRTQLCHSRTPLESSIHIKVQQRSSFPKRHTTTVLRWFFIV